VGGAALLFIQPNEVAPPPGEVSGNFSQETWKYLQSFWPDNKAAPRPIYFLSRAMMVPIALAFGILIFFYARALLFGAADGGAAVALTALRPTVLAHGRIVHTDVPARWLTSCFSLYSGATCLKRS